MVLVYTPNVIQNSYNDNIADPLTSRVTHNWHDLPGSPSIELHIPDKSYQDHLV